MITALPQLAEELGTTDRTLRRAANEGLIRGERVSPRRFDMPLVERSYLKQKWPILRELRDALRTEPSVRAAVLFGSVARGDDHDRSDIDILVDRKPGPGLRSVARRLEDRLGRRVQLVSSRDAEEAPLLLAEVLRDGRVLIDRDGLWGRMWSSRSTIERRAVRERRRIDAEVSALLDRAAWATAAPLSSPH